MKPLNNPTLSVVVPVYNAEKYIKQCIESILNQTFKDLELILVDDGSADNSGTICDEYAKIDSRVRVIHKENGGAASARNVGIALANGEYIGFCDADDYLNLKMYETLISIMKEQNLSTIECLARVYDTSGNLLDGEKSDKTLSVINEIDSIKNIFLHKGNVSLATRVTSSKVIKNIHIPEGRRVEDFYFTLLLLTKTKGTAVYNFPFYNCVTSANSVTRSAGGDIYLDAIYFYKKSIGFLADKNYNLKNEQEYFLFKAMYLLFISCTKSERKKLKKDLIEQKTYLKKHIGHVLENPYLSRKEKLVLWLSTISTRLSRLLYIIKNFGE